MFRTWRSLAALAAGPVLIVMFFGQPLFVFVFGPTWRLAGVLSPIMAVGIFFHFISYSTSNVLIVNERAGSFLAWQLAQVIAIASALFVSSRAAPNDLLMTVTALMVAHTGVALFCMVLQWHAVGGRHFTLVETEAGSTLT